MQSFKEGSRGTQILKATKQENEHINYFSIHEGNQSVFVATSDCIIYQIDLQNQKITKTYSDLEIESISCLSSFKNLLFVGGRNYCFTLIDISERRVLTIQPIKTQIRSIEFCQFTVICRNNHPIIALIVYGSKSLFNSFYLKIDFCL